MKKEYVFLFFIVAIIILLFKIVSAISQSACGTLSTVNGAYIVTGNLTTTSTCFTISANNITLDLNGSSIRGDGGSSDYGIKVQRYNFTMIKNGTVNGFGKGVYLYGSNNNISLFSLNIFNSSYGIFLDPSLNASFVNINVWNCSQAGFLSNSIGSCNLFFQNTNFSNNALNFKFNNRQCLQNIDTSNVIDGNHIIYYLINASNQTYNPASLPNAGMILCDKCNNVTFKNFYINSLSSPTYSFSNTSQGTFENVTAIGGEITFWGSNLSNLVNSSITMNPIDTESLWLQESFQSEITNNSLGPVYIQNSINQQGYHSFFNNRINSTSTAITISNSHHNTFSQNEIMSNSTSDDTIYIWTANYTTFINNTINSNINDGTSKVMNIGDDFGGEFYLNKINCNGNLDAIISSYANFVNISNNNFSCPMSNGIKLYGSSTKFKNNQLVSYYGVLEQGENSIMSNNILNISGETSYGASGYTNFTVINNTIQLIGNSSDGLAIGDNCTIDSNTLIIEGDLNDGLDIALNSNNITHNKIYVFGTNSYGIYFRASSESFFNDLQVIAKNNTALYLNTGNHNITIFDAILNSTIKKDFFISSNVKGGIWNLTNVSTPDSSPLNVSWTAGANGTLNIMWYLDALANYTNGTLIQNVNISASDVNNILRFSQLTGSNGRIIRQTLLEYTRNNTSGATTTYYSNYTFNGTSPLGENQSQSWNMSINRDLLFTFNTSVSVTDNIPATSTNTPATSSSSTGRAKTAPKKEDLNNIIDVTNKTFTPLDKIYIDNSLNMCNFSNLWKIIGILLILLGIILLAIAIKLAKKKR